MIYLDYNATTPVDAQVVARMLPYFTQSFANASSTDHRPGMEARQAVEAARQSVATLIGAMAEEISFTSGATEADNIAILGVMARAPADAELVVSAVEHPAVFEAAHRFEDRLRVVPVDSDGLVDPASVRAALTPNTALVSIMAANNETGALQPIEEIGLICREAGVPLHSDSVQAAARTRLDVGRDHIALMSLSAHKMYGPKGVGALFVRRRHPRVRIAAITYGGGHERNLRPGTLNVPAIVGFGAAADLVREVGPADCKRERRMRECLLADLHAKLPVPVQLNSPLDACLPQTLNIRLVGVSAAGVLHALADSAAIASGSACSTTSVEPSHVLLAQGRSPAAAGESLRISFGRQTSDEELTSFVQSLAYAVSGLKRLGASPTPAVA